jgi:aldose 1-epimerase
MPIAHDLFGTTSNNQAVDRFTLTNSQGIAVTVISLGATLTSVQTPDQAGKSAEVTLGHDTLEPYLTNPPYFGCTVGRFANRIANAAFAIDGKTHKLAVNEGKDQLHGGPDGFHKRVWRPASSSSPAGDSVQFTLLSPDGDQGFPGNLWATVTYTLTPLNELHLDYRATADAPTHVNLTNHSYWNLNSPGSGNDILDHTLLLNADHYLPRIANSSLPTGAVLSVKHTALDFTRPTRVGAAIAQAPGDALGYDHCLVVNKHDTASGGPGKASLAHVATLTAPRTGRIMEVHATNPAVQLYTGNFLDGSVIARGLPARKHAGLCFETQHHPDAPNQPHFPSTLLHPGETYAHKTIHRFYTR